MAGSMLLRLSVALGRQPRVTVLASWLWHREAKAGVPLARPVPFVDLGDLTGELPISGGSLGTRGVWAASCS